MTIAIEQIRIVFLNKITELKTVTRVNTSGSLKPLETGKKIAGIQSGWLIAACLLLISLVTWFTFQHSLWNGFVNYDDNIYVYENEAIKDFNSDGLISFFTGNVGQYPPLTMMVFSLIHHFAGLNPQPYHTVNLLLHILNSLLVFFFIYHIDRKIIAALIAGLLFGVHPLHVESVAWITELKDVLYSFFFLLALISYQLFTASRKNRYLYFLTLLFFLLSCLSKGMAVVFPLVLLALDRYQSGKIDQKAWIEKIPFFIIALIWGLLTLITQQSMGAVGGTDAIGWFERIFISAYGSIWYLVKMIVPLNLSVLYPMPVSEGGGLPLIIYLSPFAAVVIAIGTIKARKVRKILVFGVLFYLINLLLVLQLIPVGMAITADRYFYLSSVGIFFIVASLPGQLAEKSHGLRTVVFIAVVICITILSGLTHTQVKVWENSVTLWNQVLKKHEPYRGYALAYTNRGDAYSDRNDFEAAIRDYDRALELNPVYVDALNNRGLIRGLRQQYTEALKDFDEAIRIRPDFAKAYNNRGNAKRFLGDGEGALMDFNKAIEIKPNYLDARVNRGIIFFLIGNKQAACNDWQYVKDAGSGGADQLLLDYCR